MKRLWISVGLIALLAVLAVFHVQRLDRFVTELGRQLELTQNHLNREDWDSASPLLLDAYDRWEDNGFYLHTTLRHEDIDAIRASFREAIAFMDSRDDTGECAAVIGRLRNQLELLLEAELPSIKNLM